MRLAAKMARTNSICGLGAPFDYCELGIPALNDKPMSRILRFRPANCAAIFPDGCHRCSILEPIQKMYERRAVAFTINGTSTSLVRPSGRQDEFSHEALPRQAGIERNASYSLNSWCTNEIAIDPSPTDDATRLTLPARTSPAARIPGKLVSSR